MSMKHPYLLFASLSVVLAACGQPGTSVVNPPATPVAASPVASPAGAGTLEALAVGSGVSLQAGQTRQINVRVNGVAATPGQLRWSTTNAAVATVTQGGLISAVTAGSATVRAALSSNAGAFLDFPVTVGASPSAPAPAPAPTPGNGISATEQRVLDLTNQARAVARTCGATSYPATTPLSWNSALAGAARGHASDMAAQDYFSHTSKDGRTFVQRVTNAGYTGYRALGENIAAGQPTPESVVSGWLNSPGHCSNIMNADFRELGVGATSGGSYGIYWVQEFGARF